MLVVFDTSSVRVTLLFVFLKLSIVDQKSTKMTTAKAIYLIGGSSFMV